MAGEGPHPLSWKGSSLVRSCSCLCSNPKSLHKAGVGAGILLPSQSCWTVGAWHPPSLLRGQCPSLFSPCSSPLLYELSALGLLLLPSSHSPHTPKRCQQPLMTLLDGPQDSHTISVHQLAPVIPLQIPWSSTFLMISMPIFTWLCENLGFPSK